MMHQISLLSRAFRISRVSSPSFLTHKEKIRLKAGGCERLLPSTASCQSAWIRSRDPPKNVLRGGKKKWVCAWKREPDGEVRAAIIFPLSVAKETDQRCPHPRSQVAGDVQETAAGGRRSWWRQRFDEGERPEDLNEEVFTAYARRVHSTRRVCEHHDLTGPTRRHTVQTKRPNVCFWIQTQLWKVNLLKSHKKWQPVLL